MGVPDETASDTNGALGSRPSCSNDQADSGSRRRSGTRSTRKILPSTTPTERIEFFEEVFLPMYVCCSLDSRKAATREQLEERKATRATFETINTFIQQAFAQRGEQKYLTSLYNSWDPKLLHSFSVVVQTMTEEVQSQSWRNAFRSYWSRRRRGARAQQIFGQGLKGARTIAKQVRDRIHERLSRLERSYGDTTWLSG